MKRKVFIISRSNDLRDHLSVKKVLNEKNIPCTVISINDSQHEKLISKCRKDILLVKEDQSSSFYDLKKRLFRENIDFFTFGRLLPDYLSLSYGNLDIGFSKDAHKTLLNIKNIKNINNFTTTTDEIIIDIPPDNIPYKYLGYFRSPQLLCRNLISFLSFQGKRHKSIKILAPARPYSENSKNSRILETVNTLGRRSKIVSDLGCLKKGSVILTWSTHRSLLFFSLGFKPVPLTKCLASSSLYSKKTNLRQIISYDPELSIPELFRTLESIKLENGTGIIYKLSKQ